MQVPEHITAGTGRNPVSWDRAVIHRLLWQGPVEITFTKANGQERVMNCTLRMDLIPIEVSDTAETQRPSPNLEIITVWDIDTQHWKAIRLDRITSVRQEPSLTPDFSIFDR